MFSDGSNQTMDACTDDYTAAPLKSLLAYDLVPVVTSWVRVNLIVNEVDGANWQSWDIVFLAVIEFYGSIAPNLLASDSELTVAVDQCCFVPSYWRRAGSWCTDFQW